MTVPDVDIGGGLQKLNLMRLKFAGDFRRRAENQDTVRKFFALCDQRMCADEAVAADLCMIEYGATDSDQRVVADRAAMKHGPMSHGHVFTNDEFDAGISVQDGAILDVAVSADFDQVVVAPENRVKPDTCALLQCDASDDRSAGSNKVTVSLELGFAVAEAVYHQALA